MDIKKLKSLTKHCISNKIEYIKVDGVELKFSALAFVDNFDEFGSKRSRKGNDVRVDINLQSILTSTKDQLQPTQARDPDVSSFDDVVDEDLLFHSSG
jgi:hypothetical protein